MFLENMDGNKEFFVGFLDMLSDKTTTLVSRTAMEPYSIYHSLLNFLFTRSQLLIKNTHILVQFMPIH